MHLTVSCKLPNNVKKKSPTVAALSCTEFAENFGPYSIQRTEMHTGQSRILSTGDLRGALLKLDTLLRALKYPKDVDYTGLTKGDPASILPVLFYTLTSFSPLLAELLVSAGLELTGKTDLRFIETVYKVLRDQFNYKPSLTKLQFLQLGFSERKVLVLCDIISLTLQKHKELSKATVKLSVNHLAKRSIGFSYCSPSFATLDDLEQLEGHEEELNRAKKISQSEEDILPLNQFHDQKTLETSECENELQRCLTGLYRLSMLEKRLDNMERSKRGDVLWHSGMTAQGEDQLEEKEELGPDAQARPSTRNV